MLSLYRINYNLQHLNLASYQILNGELPCWSSEFVHLGTFGKNTCSWQPFCLPSSSIPNCLPEKLPTFENRWKHQPSHHNKNQPTPPLVRASFAARPRAWPAGWSSPCSAARWGKHRCGRPTPSRPPRPGGRHRSAWRDVLRPRLVADMVRSGYVKVAIENGNS